jgi:ribosomal protein S18 acetylase RimI-like enzyme
MSVTVLSTTWRPMTAASLYELHRALGWLPKRTEEDYAFVLRTCPAVGAWSDAALVGFARAISDGRLHAYVDDVMVDPDWRRQGIAVRLVDTLVDALEGVPMITLFCGAELVPLYERSSFVSTRQVVLHRQRRADD